MMLAQKKVTIYINELFLCKLCVSGIVNCTPAPSDVCDVDFELQISGKSQPLIKIICRIRCQLPTGRIAGFGTGSSIC